MTDHQLDITPEVTIPEHLVEQVQARLAYVDEWITGAEVLAGGAQIVLQGKEAPSTTRSRELEAKVQSVVHEMARGSFKPKVEILEDHLERSVRYTLDPMDALRAQREVSEEATGIFTFGPLMSRLIDYLDGRFLELAASFDAQPYRFPTLMSAQFLGRADYFRAFPHSLTFATHLREDLEIISAFSQEAAYEEGGLNVSPEIFSKIQALLSPATCYHLYFSLADHPLPNGQLAATAVGNCFRYESMNLTSLERMWNFSMREVIFVGSKDFVLENRELGRQRMQAVYEELGLAYRVESANDPFFVGEFRKQAAFQNAFQLKFEIRARLPFKDSTLAVGSYNYHQDFFGRHMHITLPDGSPAHTGCVAFGLERFAYAFLAQHGLDPEKWPPAVREAFT